MSYKISDSKFEAFSKRIAKLQKRAKRLSVPAPAVVKLGVEERPLVRLEGGEIEERTLANLGGDAVVGYRKYHVIEVTGEAPKLNGWEFIATVEPSGGALNLVSVSPRAGEFDAEPFVRGNAQNCDHCNLPRRRNSVYVVRHEDGTIKQVGSNCLADFLGHEDPSKVAAQAELLFQAAEAAEEGEESYGLGGPTVLDLFSYLAHVSACIHASGWLSRSAAAEKYNTNYGTADDALDALFITGPYAGRDPQPLPEITEGDRQTAKDAIAWAAALDPSPGNSFEWAIKVIADAQVVAVHRIGFAAAIVSSYSRSIEREADKVARAGASEWVGTLKKREVFAGLTVTRIRELDSQFGVTYLHGFRDTVGNEFVWFASRDQGLDLGDTVDLKATVKKHDEFQGVKQTTLTRGVVVES